MSLSLAPAVAPACRSLSTLKFSSTRPFQGPLIAPRSGARHAVVQAAAQSAVSRREAALAGGAAVAALSLCAAPAQAFLGIGEGKERAESYQKDTEDVIKLVKNSLLLPKDDPRKEEAVNNVRKATNNWVAKYRRQGAFAGRPSYGNTYSALNALAGHYNSFGVGAPLPKKRLERVTEEINLAEKLLARGR